MTKEKDNRFDGLMGAVRGKTNAQTSKRSDVETSNHSDVQKSKSKSGKASKNLGISTSKHSDIQTSKAANKSSKNVSTSKPRNDSDLKRGMRSPASPGFPIQGTGESESQAEVHSAHPNIQTSKAKSTNPDYTRTTIYLPKKMHKKLKAIALEEEKEMSGIVEELISAWLISQS